MAIISIPKSVALQQQLDLDTALRKYLMDESLVFSTLFDKTLETFLHVDDNFDLEKVEAEVY